MTCSYIEQTIHLRMFQHPKHHIDTVAHPYKIATLLAMGTVVAVRFKEAYLTRGAILFKEMAYHTHLHTFMVFVGSIDIEELQSDHLRIVRGKAAVIGNEFIDGVFAPPVGIEGTQLVEMLTKPKLPSP